MSSLPKCPKCGSGYTYEDRNMFVCPECAHEWSKEAVTETSDVALVVKDAHGSGLQDGDSVTVIKDLEEAGRRRGLSQPKVSGLFRGNFTNVSERKLMDCLNRLGYDIEIKVKPAAKRVGHVKLAA